MKKLFGLVGALFLLVGCQATPPQEFKVDDYADVPPIHLTVSEVKIESTVARYDRMPHIEYKMPLRPEEVLQTWATNRFNAVSMSSPVIAKIVIKEASMTEQDKPTDSWYTLDNISYRLTYEVSLQFEKEGKVIYEQNVNGWERAAIPQKSSLADKEKTWEKMMNNMVHKVNDKIEDDIPAEYK